MSHEVTNTDKIAYAGDEPWHGINCTQVSKDDPIAVWKDAAGLTWEIKQSPLQYMHDDVPRTFDGQQVLYRSDNGEALAVTSEQYKISQPAQVVDFFGEICDRFGFKMETLGSLKGGRMFWGLAETPVGGMINNDAHNMYMLLTTSADRSMASTAKPTAVRVVCNNTLQAALGRTGKEVRMRHSTEFDVDAILRQLDLIDLDKAWDGFNETMQKLNSVAVPDEAVESIYAELLQPGHAARIRKHVEEEEKHESMVAQIIAETENKDFAAVLQNSLKPPKAPKKVPHLDKVLKSYNEAPGAVPGTFYGVTQGVSHYVDHVKGKEDTRVYNALYGPGVDLKKRTVEAGLAVVDGLEGCQEIQNILAG